MRAAAALALAAVALGGCFGSDDHGRQRTPAAAPSRQAAHGTAVIRGWVDALRQGRLEKASRYFALPATVANGSAPVRLQSRAGVRQFNESLPCGARLVRTRRDHGYTIGVFRLTDRPGGDCGTGAGGLAATAFQLEHGKIVTWIRVPVPGQGGRRRPVIPPRLGSS